MEVYKKNVSKLLIFIDLKHHTTVIQFFKGRKKIDNKFMKWAAPEHISLIDVNSERSGIFGKGHTQFK